MMGARILEGVCLITIPVIVNPLEDFGSRKQCDSDNFRNPEE